MDAILINLVAIMVGLGVELFASIFPISKDLGSILKPIAAVVYGVWCAAYFILFWSTAGQTPGAYQMRIRLVAANEQKVKPLRAVVRWIGMNLAMLPLFAGYLPVLFRRRPFPDWLAHTLVVRGPELSVAAARQAAVRAAHDGWSERASEPSSASKPSLSASGDGSGSPTPMREPPSQRTHNRPIT
jgi:uncharacterized RDD family membrane protein YckC